MNRESNIAEKIANEVMAKYPDSPPDQKQLKQWREEAEERRRHDGVKERKFKAWETLEDKVTVAKIRKFLLDIQDFAFRHRVGNPGSIVEVTGKEIEDLKWAVGRALDLT